MKNGAILLATGPWDPEPWIASIRTAAPDRPLHVWPALPDRSAIRYALVWKPPAGLLGELPNLEAIFSLGAGVDHLVFQDLPDVPIVRVVSPDLTQRMTEWIVLQVLLHHRRQRAYDRQQAEHRWRELPQPVAQEVRVGVMGMGVLGTAAANALAALGFQVAGWSRRPREDTASNAFARYAGQSGLSPFLARTDILVCLLPLTRDTRGILAMPLFRQLARDGAPGRGPILINAGRGGLQVEADIVAAIGEGTLGGASIDVFETEPLPADSPLWDLPNVVVSPHVSATSAPAAIAPEILRQIDRYEADGTLANLVSREMLY
ncbi:MAG TPA: glyoxylate/hydroxypyruvate reductase A [Bauldia sp.]|nr:glyoxylate/hydroxypyruvate reductase A [Bauldia sp.]